MNITLKDIGEIVGGIITMALFVLLAWLYLIVTPDQLSAEADLHAQECDDAGVEYAPYFNQWKASQTNR